MISYSFNSLIYILSGGNMDKLSFNFQSFVRALTWLTADLSHQITPPHHEPSITGSLVVERVTSVVQGMNHVNRVLDAATLSIPGRCDQQLFSWQTETILSCCQSHSASSTLLFTVLQSYLHQHHSQEHHDSYEHDRC